jgi:hypothetical protein
VDFGLRKPKGGCDYRRSKNVFDISPASEFATLTRVIEEQISLTLKNLILTGETRVPRPNAKPVGDVIHLRAVLYRVALSLIECSVEYRIRRCFVRLWGIAIR